MADLPFPQLEPRVLARLVDVFDVEGKLPDALQALGPVAGRDVVVVGGEGRCAARLRALGGRVTTCPASALSALPEASADVALSCWDGLDSPGVRTAHQIGSLARALRANGRLLIVADYGRDDVDRLRTVADPAAHYAALRRRDGWFADQGFKVHVIHARWTFASVEEAESFLAEAFGSAGVEVAAGLRQPRVSHKIVVYHRTFGSEGPVDVEGGRGTELVDGAGIGLHVADAPGSDIGLHVADPRGSGLGLDVADPPGSDVGRNAVPNTRRPVGR